MTARAAELQNREAEQAVLGALLIDNAVAYELQALLQADDFSLERHGWVYSAVLELWQAQQPADFVTVCARLEEQGRLAEIGGAAYLTRLINETPSAVYASHYGAIVKRLADKRRLVAAATQIAALAYSEAEPGTVQAQGEALLATATRQSGGAGFLGWHESFGYWADNQLERAVQMADKKPKLTLPWTALSFVKPLRADTLAVVTAAPAVGKTAFAENLAEFWARRGFAVLYAHFELSHETMLDRRMARWSGESLDVIERGELTARMQQADETILAWPGQVHYLHCAGWSIGQLIAEARRYRQAGKCDVLIVDYFNKARLEIAKNMSETTARGLMFEALKVFCEREAAPTVVLAQLTKAGKAAERKTGADIRDTGEIEDKCNLLFTLDRPVLNAPLLFGDRLIEAGRRSPKTTVRVDKQTLGDIGERTLIYIGERFMFVDQARE